MKAPRFLIRVAVSVAAVAIVTGAIFGLKEVAPVLSLGGLYVFAVLPIAVWYGLGYAIVGVGREHARLQLLLPAAAAHARR